MSDEPKEEGPITPTIEPLMLERLLRYDAEHKCARMAVALEQAQFEAQALRHNQRVAELSQQADAANKTFLAHARTIEATHRIDLKQWAFMPESGALTRIGDPS